MGHGDDGPSHRHLGWRGEHIVNVRAVDLDDVDRQRTQAAQVRIAGAEVVDRNLDADRPQRGKRASGLGRVGCQHAFRHLDAEVVRPCPRLEKDGLHALRKIVASQLGRRDVHVHAHLGQTFALPRGGLRARRAQHPFADGDDLAALLCHRYEFSGGHRPERRGLPAQQRLDPLNAAIAQLDLRLVLQ